MSLLSRFCGLQTECLIHAFGLSFAKVLCHTDQFSMLLPSSVEATFSAHIFFGGGLREHELLQVFQLVDDLWLLDSASKRYVPDLARGIGLPVSHEQIPVRGGQTLQGHLVINPIIISSTAVYQVGEAESCLFDQCSSQQHLFDSSISVHPSSLCSAASESNPIFLCASTFWPIRIKLIPQDDILLYCLIIEMKLEAPQPMPASRYTRAYPHRRSIFHDKNDLHQSHNVRCPSTNSANYHCQICNLVRKACPFQESTRKGIEVTLASEMSHSRRKPHGNHNEDNHFNEKSAHLLKSKGQIINEYIYYPVIHNIFTQSPQKKANLRSSDRRFRSNSEYNAMSQTAKYTISQFLASTNHQLLTPKQMKQLIDSIRRPNPQNSQEGAK